MADTFLTLDIDAYGITACIVKLVSKKSYIKETCRITYKDLPEADTARDVFESAWIYLRDHMDMTSCSAATLLIPSSSVSFRNIELPFKSARKIRQILPLEIASYLPAPEEKYISDFHILDIPYQEGHIPVFTASVSHLDIDKYIDLLLSYSIKPEIITPKGTAAAICLLKENPFFNNFICLDLGDHENTITLVYNRKPFFIRSFPALQYKPEELADTARQALLGFRQTTGFDTCFDLFITVDRELKGIKKIYYGLENLLHYQTKYQQPDEAFHHKVTLKKINYANLFAQLHPHKNAGLFFNFYKPKTGLNPIFQKSLKTFATSIFLACILLICSLYNLHLEIAGLDEQIDTNKNKAATIYKTTFPNEKSARHPLLQMQSLVKKAITKSNSTKKNHQMSKESKYKAAQVMAILSDIIPETIDMEISKFFLNQSTLVISGTTDNFKNVDKIKNLMEKADLFKQISINSALADKKTDQVLFKFTIQMSEAAS